MLHLCCILLGNQEEIDERLATGDKGQLAMFTVVIRKELEMKKSELRTLRQESAELKKKMSDKNSRLKDAREKIRHLEHDVTETEAKNSKLRSKMETLQKALGSPSDPAVSFANRLIHESPAPLSKMNKRQKLTHEEDGASPMLSSNTSKPNLSPQKSKKVLASMDSTVEDLPVSTLDFSDTTSPSKPASSSQKSSSALKNPSNIANVSGLSNFNLFKKSIGSGLMGKTNSSIRSGYNGFGGHEKHVQGSGRTFSKPTITSTKRKNSNVFAKSKTLKTPSLPTLDTLLD